MLRPLVSEALGLTTDEHPYAYLSDGGHFENLGLYEMVRRRCRTVLVVDAGCDLDYSLQDLGNAIRKVRIDMGIEIRFVGFPISKSQDGGRSYCAVGRIHYREVDGEGARDGTLVYLKPVLYGDEPADVRNYRSMHPAFPHESTADQWFDESQLEAYRSLGRHALDTICGSGFLDSLDEFQDLARRHAAERAPVGDGSAGARAGRA